MSIIFTENMYHPEMRTRKGCLMVGRKVVSRAPVLIGLAEMLPELGRVFKAEKWSRDDLVATEDWTSQQCKLVFIVNVGLQFPKINWSNGAWIIHEGDDAATWVSILGQQQV